MQSPEWRFPIWPAAQFKDEDEDEDEDENNARTTMTRTTMTKTTTMTKPQKNTQNYCCYYLHISRGVVVSCTQSFVFFYYYLAFHLLSMLSFKNTNKNPKDSEKYSNINQLKKETYKFFNYFMNGALFPYQNQIPMT